MPEVFVVSSDWILRAALRAELLEAGLRARGMQSLSSVSAAFAGGEIPAVVVLDAAMVETPGDETSIANLARHSCMLVVTSHVQLPSGSAEWMRSAAAVLHRPVRIGEIVTRVKEIVKGQAA
jgi:DNA-binding NtrC family response regulator